MSPGQPISREAACEALFPHLEAVKAATALRKSLSMARSALSALGHDATQVLAADRDRIWVDATRAGLSLEVDLDTHQAALRGGLALAPGADARRTPRGSAGPGGHSPRRRALCRLGAPAKRSHRGVASRGSTGSSPRSCQRRGAVECGRRCALVGVLHRTRPGMRGGGGRFDAELLRQRGLRHLVVRTYDRCRAALEDLGLRATPALDQLRRGGHSRSVAPPPRASFPSIARRQVGTAVPGRAQDRQRTVR